MSSPEVPKGVEALTILPFRNVVYPSTVALTELTTRTHTVLRTNVQTDLSSLPNNTPQGRMVIDRYRAVTRSPGTFFSPGGLVIKSDSLDNFYSLPPQHTFQDVAAVGFADIIEQYMKPGQIGTRKPSVFCINYMLDLLTILNPKMASYQDGVKAILNGYNKLEIFPTPSENLQFLGGLIDDAQERRYNVPGLKDILSDSEGVLQFREAVLATLSTEEEKQDLHQGAANARQAALIAGRTVRRFN